MTTMTSPSPSTQSTTTTHSSRKSQRVYRSPSDPNDPSPFSAAKIKKEPVTVKLEEEEEAKQQTHLMDIDEKDEEAGTILMALAQHADRITTSRNHSSSAATYNEKPTKSNSMSIRNLLGQLVTDPEADASIMPPHVSPFHSLSSESRPLYASNYDARRNSSKKGFQICIQPRRSSAAIMDDDYPHYHNQQPQQRRKQSFRHPSTVRIPLANNNKPLMKYKRNTTHIHISYRIHAHRQSLQPLQQHPMYENNHSNSRYETSTSPYPSAFRAPSQIKDWNNQRRHSSSSSYHYREQHRQDNTA